jgi:hypothetical protein
MSILPNGHTGHRVQHIISLIEGLGDGARKLLMGTLAARTDLATGYKVLSPKEHRQRMKLIDHLRGEVALGSHHEEILKFMLDEATCKKEETEMELYVADVQNGLLPIFWST